MKNIAFIGTNGVPNKYGGFESFLDAICPDIVSTQTRVIITCDKAKYSVEERLSDYQGIERVFVNVKANGAASTWHDFVAFLHVLKAADAIVVLGVSAGPFFAIFRLLCALYSVKLIVNIDGIEWRRTKFNSFTRGVLWLYDLFAQTFSNVIVYDNPALIEYVYKSFRPKSIYIPYSADHVQRDKTVSIQSGTALTICRIEPENNIEMLIDGFLGSELSEYVLIGNWTNSDYGTKLREKYKTFNRLKLLDPIYDSLEVLRYRESCQYYLHGHSVGGTNPSLLEMLPYRCAVLCYDCVFNVESVGDDAYYFNSSLDLAACLNHLSRTGFSSKNRSVPYKYLRSTIAKQYIDVALN